MSTALNIINPATEDVVASVNMHDVEEVDRAIERAATAYTSWKTVTPADRARILRKFSDVVDSHIEELAQLEVANSGHTISNARWEAGNVRDVLAYYSGAPERHAGKQIPVAGGVDITFYEPLGVVGIIVPWNFPMPIAGWGLGPALAAGNTVVMKPATLTPLTALRLAELVEDRSVLVSESGIRTRDDVLKLHAAGVRAVLVGESLMRSQNIQSTMRDIFAPVPGPVGNC